jgi:hypothetical protein
MNTIGRLGTSQPYLSPRIRMRQRRSVKGTVEFWAQVTHT